MLKEWMPKRVRIQMFILLIGQCSSYWGGMLLGRNRVHYNMTLPIDGNIPVVNWTVLIYLGSFFFWIYNYCNILKTEPERGSRFFRAELYGKLICFLTYVAIPTTLIRPEIAGKGIFSALMHLLYFQDSPYALFPSMHCFVSWMCVIGMRGKPEFSMRYRILSIIAAFAIFIATMTTKQHVFVDVIAGVALAEFVYFVEGLKQARRENSAKAASLET